MPNLVDLSDRHRRRRAAQNVTSVYNAAPAQIQDAGKHWYDNVHEATAKGVRGTSTDVSRGAGIVAAVSPNMDWDNKNIHALKEIHSLREGDWAQIAKGEKSPVAGMSISQSPVNGLLKAKRLLDHEDVDSVLDRRTAPKTNSFAHNIAEPHVDGHVTIDGRAHDIAANSMRGWKENRGINTAQAVSGKPTRYEHFEQSYRVAADAITRQTGEHVMPHQVQGVTWEMGKAFERSGTTKTGQPRKQGPRRVGQPYVGPGALPRQP